MTSQWKFWLHCACASRPLLSTISGSKRRPHCREQSVGCSGATTAIREHAKISKFITNRYEWPWGARYWIVFGLPVPDGQSSRLNLLAPGRQAPAVSGQLLYPRDHVPRHGSLCRRSLFNTSPFCKAQLLKVIRTSLRLLREHAPSPGGGEWHERSCFSAASSHRCFMSELTFSELCNGRTTAPTSQSVSELMAIGRPRRGHSLSHFLSCYDVLLIAFGLQRLAIR